MDEETDMAAPGEADATEEASQGEGNWHITVELNQLYWRAGGPGVLNEQQLIFAVMIRAFNEFVLFTGRGWRTLFKEALDLSWVLALLCGLAFLFQILVKWLVGLVYSISNISLIWLLYAAPITLIFAAAHRRYTKQYLIQFQQDKNVITGLDFGRLSAVNHPSEGRILWLLIVVTLGLEAGMLYTTWDHLDLPIEGTLSESWLLALNSLFQGVLRDVMEVYKINLGAKIELSTFARYVFSFFEATYATLFVLLLYLSYQRHKMRKLLNSKPPNSMTVLTLANWIRQRCLTDPQLPRHFFDEFLFLLLCEAYLRSDFEMVRELGNTFTRVRVADDVRIWFTGPEGEALLPSKPGAE